MTKKYLKIWAREYSVQYCETAVRCIGPETRPYNTRPVADVFFVPENGNQAVYAEARSWKKLEQELLTIGLQNNRLKKFIAQFHYFGKLYVRSCQRWGKYNFPKFSKEDIISLHQKYTALWRTYSLFLWHGFNLNEVVAHEGRRILEQKNLPAEYRQRILASLFSPSKKTGVLRLQEHLVQLKSRGKKLSAGECKYILKKYVWMSCLDLHNTPWTEKDIRELFMHLQPGQRGLPFSRAKRLAGLTPREAQFFTSLREIAYIKDMRDVYRRQGIFHIRGLYQEIAERLGLTLKQAAYLTDAEIHAALLRGVLPPKSELQSRQHGFVMYRSQGRTYVRTQKSVIARWKKYTKQAEGTAPRISGITACSGSYTGTVAVVRGVTDLAKVKRGNVLVAITTHPDFLPAMQRAGAIITDEGGLTSHAAIVARELGIPCIVGTKTATQVFNDGDMVEVDANKGLIKKI